MLTQARSRLRAAGRTPRARRLRRRRLVGGGSDERGRDRRAGTGRGRADDLELARLHRPGQERLDRRVRGADRASRSSTSRTSTTTPQFFGKVQPLLDQGESGGRDIFVVTDWMAKQMYDLGYLQEIDHDDLPTVFENICAGSSQSEPSTPTASSRSRGRAG